MKKSEILTLGLMAGGGILGSIAQETVKASVGVEDAYVSAAATIGTMYAASMVDDGSIKKLLLGASAVMAMNSVSEAATLVAQKTANPTVDKLVELLPRVKAPNVLANPTIEAPIENFQTPPQEEFVEENFDDQGVNGLENQRNIVHFIS